ncbi:MAG: aminodeoxychorismate lyase [Halioglobus sp.]
MALPLPDRGLDFGDGLFETMLYAQGRLFYPKLHLDRLQSGLKTLGFPDCLGTARIHLNKVVAELPSLNISRAAVRLTITRGSGPRGYAPPIECQPRVIIAVEADKANWNGALEPATLGLATTRLASQTQLAGIKHLNRLEQVLAARERLHQSFDEMVMLDSNDDAISVISGNLFVVKAGELITPLLSECGVKGTRRHLLINDWAPALGINVREQRIDVSTLADSDELFFTNSLIGLRPVSCFGNAQWAQWPVFTALRALYWGDNE